MMAYLSHPYGGSEKNKEDAAQITAGFYALMNAGEGVFNPLDDLSAAYLPEREILYKCKGALESCGIVVFCPGWERSRGCRYEHMIAKRHNIPRIYLTEEDVTILRSLAPRFRLEGNAA